MKSAFEYIQEAGGIEQAKDYPYDAESHECIFNSKFIALKVTGNIVKENFNEDEMKQMLVNTGPLAIALNADPLMFYGGGIIDASKEDCNPDGLNHGVTLVGYGSEKGQDYWIVRNSWSKSWGEEGYFRIARGKGTCGINKYVTSAIIETVSEQHWKLIK